jgi:O-antigen ligase
MGRRIEALVVALAGGALAGSGRPVWAVGTIGAVGVWIWPTLGLMALLVLTAGMTPLGQNWALETPWGGFQIADLVLAILVCRAVVGVRPQLGREHSLEEGIILLILALAAVAAAQAVLLRGTPPRWALSEMRPLAYLSVALVVPRAALGRNWARWWGRLIVAIGVAVAAVAIIHHLRGTTTGVMPEGGRVTYLESIEGTGVVRVARVRALGTPFVILGLFYCLSRLALGVAASPLWLAASGFLGLQMVLTFSRNLWVSVALGAVVVVAGLPARVLRTVIVASAALLLLGVFAVLVGRVTETEYLTLDRVVTERALSLFQARTLESSQIQGRLREVQLAWPTIASNMVAGVGLGTPYLEHPVWGQGETLSYLHNGYLAVLLKTGVLGLVAFAVLSVRMLRDSWKLRNSVHAEWGASLLGFVVVFLVSSIVTPRFFECEWMTVLGVGIGILALARRSSGLPASPAR